MKPLSRIIFYITLGLIYSSSAFAADTPDVSILNTVTQAMTVAATDQIGPMALGWFGALVSLQFIITNFSSLKNGSDITEVFAKVLGLLFSVGISLLLITNGPEFIDSVGHGIFGKFLSKIPGAGAIITATLGICTSLVAAVVAIGFLNTAVAMLLVNVILVVFGVGMYMATKVFMLYLELGMVVLLSPLSFSLLGLGALREQGIAPLKSLISLIYRAVVLGVIYSAFGEVVDVAGAQLAAIKWSNPLAWPAAMNIILAMLCAYPIIAYLAYKSDSMASSLAGGSTNMGAGDVASAAAAGAAAGAAVMTGSSSAAGAAAKIPSMGEFMKSVVGAGSISNASGMGTGSTPMGPTPMSPPSMSKAGGGGSSTGSNSPASGGQGKSAISSLANSSPRPSDNAQAAQTASNAADGVTAAGGSQAASDAAGTAALAGGSNEMVSAAVMSAGGTAAQGAAAATAMAIGEAGGSPAAIKNGAAAVGAGKSSADVGEAVAKTLVPGTAFGHSQDVSNAAANASRTKPAQVDKASPANDSTSNGGISGAAPSGATMDDVMKAIGQQKKPTGMDHAKELNQHIAQEKATTHISINANHSD